MAVGFIRVYNAELERHAVMPETGWQHQPGWEPVKPVVVRANPWDFEEPEPEEGGPEPDSDATPDLGPPPDEIAAELPAGNARADEWRTYAEARGIANADDYSRDELRDYFLSDQPLPSKE